MEQEIHNVPDASVALAIAEVRQPQSRVAQRLLTDHKVRLIDGEPHIVRVDREEEDGSVIVYFGLQNKSYFLAVRVDPLPAPKIRGVSVEAGVEAYLVCFSTMHPLGDLLSAATLTPTEQWDMDAGGGSSGLNIKTSLPMADGVDDNINGLLNVLEGDAAGIRRLAALSQASVQVHWYGYAPAMPLLKLKAATIQRLAALGLALDFDLYAK
ncbi:MAG: DUF4279 domain-containing protein [Chloroflexi bacterium]|nr:DUF4279 domain-containing protein [Chloroflexota bacterium]MCL5275329.1 DUF4279 domain-containing protein [Chloroflexota bacterium]